MKLLCKIQTLNLFITMICCNNCVYSQDNYLFLKPDSTQLLNGQFFNISINDTIKIDCLNKYIARVYSNDEHVLTQWISVKRNTRIVQTNIDSLNIINDSILKNIRNRVHNHKIDIYMFLDTINEFDEIEVLNPLLKLSYYVYEMKMQDSNRNNNTPFVQMSGNVYIEGQHSNGLLEGQGVPLNYLRTYVASELKIGGLPFNISYVYTTESNSKSNQINNFRFSFDNNQFLQNINKGISNNLEANKLHKLSSLTDIDMESVEKEINKLEKQHNSPKYKTQLEKSYSILKLAGSDTSAISTYKHKKAKETVHRHEHEAEKLNLLKSQKQEYLKQLRVANTFISKKEAKIERRNGLKEAAVDAGFDHPFIGTLLSMKKFDIGFYTADYNDLIFSGIGLNGINLELNYGNFYTAFSWGITYFNMLNPIQINPINGGRSITHTKLGVGRTEKSLLALTLLRGKDIQKQFLQDTLFKAYTPNTNYVFGIDYTYWMNDKNSLTMEYARSFNQNIDEMNRPNSDGISNLFERNLFNGAFIIKTNNYLNKSKTKFGILFRIVDQLYNSYGTPYLRNDNLRFELRAEQPLLKSIIFSSITYRFDQDNINKQKHGTSRNHTYIYRITIRKKKIPTLSLTYSPSFQSFYSNQLSATFNNRLHVLSFTGVYTINKKSTMANFTTSYIKQLSSGNNEFMPVYHIDLYALNTSVFFKKLNFKTIGLFTYSKPWVAIDTSNMLMIDFETIKSYKKDKYVIRMGGGYYKDHINQSRYIIKAGYDMIIGYGIKSEISIERHYVNRNEDTIKSSVMNLGRITIIKSF